MKDKNKHDPAAEYRLITDHVFKEANLQLNRNKFFMGIILALFTAFGFFVNKIVSIKDLIDCKEAMPCTDFISYGDFEYLLLLVPVVGFFISLFWVKLLRKVEGFLRLRVKSGVHPLRETLSWLF